MRFPSGGLVSFSNWVSAPSPRVPRKDRGGGWSRGQGCGAEGVSPERGFGGLRLSGPLVFMHKGGLQSKALLLKPVKLGNRGAVRSPLSAPLSARGPARGSRSPSPPVPLGLCVPRAPMGGCCSAAPGVNIYCPMQISLLISVFKNVSFPSRLSVIAFLLWKTWRTRNLPF